MNVVTLIGNLASDVEVRDVAEGRRVAGFTLAVDRRGPAGGADFVRVTVWGKQADSCARHLAKGRRVAVDGRLRSGSWEDTDGKRRRSVEVVANHVQFLSGQIHEQEVPFEAATAAS